jgi:siroheme synthase-like protein
MRDLVGHERVSVSEREYEPADIGDATLVVAATDRREVNARVAADAHAKARLVNVADEPAEGDWVSVATHRAGPLVIAVSVGGVPTAATRIRDAIAERFDRRYAGALTALIALRRQVLDAGGTDAWRQVDRELVGPDFCERVECH